MFYASGEPARTARRYVQHHSLADAHAGTPRPTLHGASKFWYDDHDGLRSPPPSPRLSEAVREDDRTVVVARKMVIEDTLAGGA